MKKMGIWGTVLYKIIELFCPQSLRICCGFPRVGSIEPKSWGTIAHKSPNKLLKNNFCIETYIFIWMKLKSHVHGVLMSFKGHAGFFAILLERHAIFQAEFPLDECKQEICDEEDLCRGKGQSHSEVEIGIG